MDTGADVHHKNTVSLGSSVMQVAATAAAAEQQQQQQQQLHAQQGRTKERNLLGPCLRRLVLIFAQGSLVIAYGSCLRQLQRPSARYRALPETPIQAASKPLLYCYHPWILPAANPQVVQRESLGYYS
jgi:hypothetical protein